MHLRQSITGRRVPGYSGRASTGAGAGARWFRQKRSELLYKRTDEEEKNTGCKASLNSAQHLSPGASLHIPSHMRSLARSRHHSLTQSVVSPAERHYNRKLVADSEIVGRPLLRRVVVGQSIIPPKATTVGTCGLSMARANGVSPLCVVASLSAPRSTSARTVA